MANWSIRRLNRYVLIGDLALYAPLQKEKAGRLCDQKVERLEKSLDDQLNTVTIVRHK